LNERSAIRRRWRREEGVRISGGLKEEKKKKEKKKKGEMRE